MKGKDIALIGGVGIGAYLLYQLVKGQSIQQPASGGGGGTNLSLGGLVPNITLPGISIGGDSSGDGGGGGIAGTLTDLFGKLLEAPASLLKDTGGNASGLDDIIKKFTDAFDKAKSVKDFYDDATKKITDTAETAKKLIEDGTKKVNDVISEFTTPGNQPGLNSEWDLHNWFSQHLNPYDDDVKTSSPAQEIVKAKYSWGWSWLPDSLNEWMGKIAYQNQGVPMSGFEYSPAIQGILNKTDPLGLHTAPGMTSYYDRTNPYAANLQALMKAERENYIVSQKGPRPGTPELGGEWQSFATQWGKGFQYYIPGF